jgi:hypothetical protein
MNKIITTAVFCSALSACQTTDKAADMMTSAKFNLSGATIAPLAQDNLCTRIGGNSVQPNLTVQHDSVAGQTIRVRMYDVHNDGTTTEHGIVSVASEGDGTTTVSSGFMPPCNTTGGRKNSSYRFDVSTDGDSLTTTWGGYDSTAGEII